MNMKKTLAALCAMSACVAFADSTPVMVSLVTPVQAPSSDFDVTGFRLSLIFGASQDFAGLDIGISQYSAGDFTGVAVGGVNVAGGRILGGQIGLVNWGSDRNATWEDRSTGAQIGIFNYAGAFCGLQEGVVNITPGGFCGLQSGIVNNSGNCYGVQCGYYFIFGVNIADGNVRGCQIGLLNYAETMESGMQIGLINIISKNGWAPVLPIVNGHF